MFYGGMKEFGWGCEGVVVVMIDFMYECVFVLSGV